MLYLKAFGLLLIQIMIALGVTYVLGGDAIMYLALLVGHILISMNVKDLRDDSV